MLRKPTLTHTHSQTPGDTHLATYGGAHVYKQPGTTRRPRYKQTDARTAAVVGYTGKWRLDSSSASECKHGERCN